MKAYRVIWSGSVGLLLAVGIFMVIIDVAPIAAIMIGVGAAFGVCVARSILDEHQKRRSPVRRYVELGTYAFAVGLGTTGLLAVLGVPGLFVVLLGVGLSPPALRWAAPYLPARPTDRPTDSKAGSTKNASTRKSSKDSTTTGPAGEAPKPALVVQAVNVGSLTDADLIHAWQLSFVFLQHSAEPSAHCSVAELRGRYLDELERRDPAGFGEWLANAPRAASNPARYMKSRTPETPT